MDSLQGWLVAAPIARAVKALPRAFRAESCYLLGRGQVVTNPRCSACGLDFRSPRRFGERFRVALEVFEPPAPDHVSTSTTRLFVGRKVLVARVSSALQVLVERSISYVGPRVMVAVLAGEGSERVPALFCSHCADAIASHLNVSNQRYYAWDWLADFEPRRILPRLYRRMRPKLQDLPRFAALPASDPPRALTAPG